MDQASETLGELEKLKGKTQSDLQSAWFPLVVFGGLTMLSAAVLTIWGGEALGIFWLVGGIGGSIATATFYRNRELRIGVTDAGLPYMLTAGVLFVGAFGLGMVGGSTGNETLAFAGPPIVIALGFLVFAYLERQLSLAIVALLLLGIGVFFAIRGVDGDITGAVLTLVYGAVMFVTGLVYAVAEFRTEKR